MPTVPRPGEIFLWTGAGCAADSVMVREHQASDVGGFSP
jgi:hypothetical protein